MFAGRGGTIYKREGNQAEAKGMFVNPERRVLGLSPSTELRALEEYPDWFGKPRRSLCPLSGRVQKGNKTLFCFDFSLIVREQNIF